MWDYPQKANIEKNYNLHLNFTNMEKTNPIEEAKRYVANAKMILKEKAIKDGLLYQDSKYVKLAGHALWTGCLLALQYALKIEQKKGHRLDIKDFKEAASKRNKKLLAYVTSGYNIMHLSMSYDGEKSYGVSKSGVDIANEIIKWCENNADSNSQADA